MSKAPPRPEPADCTIVRGLPFTPMEKSETSLSVSSCCEGYTRRNVQCSASNRVISLQVNSANDPAIGNILTEELGKLSELTLLDWRDAKAPPGQKWTIPLALGSLTKLKYLKAVNVSLQGSLPGSVLVPLTNLEVRPGVLWNHNDIAAPREKRRY